MRFRQLGAAAIEFALVLPIYLLILDAVVELSLLSYDQAIVLNAARSAAREGMVLSDPKLNAADIEAIARLHAEPFLISFGSVNALQVTVTPATENQLRSLFHVTVDYTYTSLLGGSFLAAIKRPIVISSTASQFNE